MRFRVGDPGWQDARVTVDGVPIHHAVELDTDEGWAQVLARDSGGRIIVEGDQVKTERIRGHVVLILPG